MSKKYNIHLSIDERETLSLRLARGHSMRTMSRVIVASTRHCVSQVCPPRDEGTAPEVIILKKIIGNTAPKATFD